MFLVSASGEGTPSLAAQSENLTVSRAPHSQDGRRARQSFIWARDGADHYVEPAWVSERLFAVEPFIGEVIDPACGFGTIVKVAWAAHLPSVGWDIEDRGFPLAWQGDFLSSRQPVCNIVTNPPFGLVREFAEQALMLARHKVAMLFPTARLNAARWLEATPLAHIWFISPRPSMPPGHIIAAGQKPAGGKTDFCWLVWSQGHSGPTQIGWLRKAEHRPDEPEEIIP
jgi:hypothetical protein